MFPPLTGQLVVQRQIRVGEVVLQLVKDGDDGRHVAVRDRAGGLTQPLAQVRGGEGMAREGGGTKSTGKNRKKSGNKLTFYKSV